MLPADRLHAQISNDAMDGLVDISNIKIATNANQADRMIKYISDVKNPYLFRVGKIVVNLAFSPGGNTIQDSICRLVNN